MDETAPFLGGPVRLTSGDSTLGLGWQVTKERPQTHKLWSGGTLTTRRKTFQIAFGQTADGLEQEGVQLRNQLGFLRPLPVVPVGGKVFNRLQDIQKFRREGL